MCLHARSLKMAYLSFASALLICAGVACASDGEEFGLASTRPTLGSIDCLRPASIMSLACPYEIAVPGSLQQVSDIGAHRVLRLLASERLQERFRFLKPYDPNRLLALRAGFSAKMVMGYPGVNMYIDLQDLDVDMQLFGGGTVRPFNNNNPYAVIRFSWRW